MASPASSVAATPITFDLTLNQAHTDSLQWIAQQQQQQQAAENAEDKDPRAPTAVPPVYLPSPVIRFVVPDANAVRSSVEQFCDEQHLTQRQRASMVTLTHAMGMQIAEEKMTHIYYQLLLAEKRMNSISGSVSLSLVSNNRQLSDGIGHYDDDDTNESLNGNGDNGIHSTTQAPTALSKWKQLARVPVVPHKVDPTSLSALLSALLSTIVGKPTHGPADSPLAKLYHLACVYHTEHLIYLQKKQAAYTQLRNEQSKEMEIICQQAQQSEIDAASMGMEDSTSSGLNASIVISTANSSTGSASALSDAISSLVQSHLHSSSVLEDEWEHRVENWCRIARRKFAIYVKDTWEEYLDRLERTKSAQAAHDRLAAEKVRQTVEKKRNKILQTEQEELEESARMEKEQAISAQKDVAAQIKVFTSPAALLQEHASANMALPPSTWGSNLLGLDELDKPAENSNGSSKSGSLPTSNSSNALPSPAGSPASNSAAAASAAPPPQFASSASTPELSTAPFPFQSLLGTTSVFLGGVNSSNLFQLFLSNDPLFIASSERVGATNTSSAAANASSPNTANASAASGNATNTAAVPISSSPLISFSHYSAHLDALFGSRGKGGLSAMLLPHHLSPLLHATHANPHRDQLQSSGANDANDALDETKLDSQASKLRASPLYFAASRRLREHAMHYFNISNLYVKNWLQYARNHNDLLCEEFGVQMERMEKKLKEIAEKKNNIAAGAFPNLHQANSGSTAIVAQPSTAAAGAPLVSPGDIIVTRHSHVLNAQLCFHVNVLPRRGGPATAGGASGSTPSEDLSAGSSPAGVGRMSEEEVKQQQYLFTTVLPHLFNLACEYNIHTLSVPLIWDNILLSMWTISGNYVGFGWKDADASNLSNTTSAASNIRSEELAVYECMVRYIESHLRAIKFCLGQLPKNCPLKQIVFYLPASATQNTLLYNIDQTNTNVSNLIGENMDIGSGGKDGVDPHAANHPTINAHPFLAKCKLLFREVFQA